MKIDQTQLFMMAIIICLVVVLVGMYLYYRARADILELAEKTKEGFITRDRIFDSAIKEVRSKDFIQPGVRQ